MHSVCQNSVRCVVHDDGLFGPLQGQTGKYFFVVQAGTFALKLPAKQPEHAGDQGAPEQTVSSCSADTLCSSTLKQLPAKQPEHAGDQGAPEQTVSLKVPDTLNPQP